MMTVQCPNLECKVSIDLRGISGMKIRCICKHTFCRKCFDPWAGAQGYCESAKCDGMRFLLKNCLETREFSLKKDGNYVKVKTPTHRACPKCFFIIENYKCCKHTKCPCTPIGESFCFVCLSTRSESGWPCGSYSSFCQVAPRQVL
jgi:hypothetical protein